MRLAATAALLASACAAAPPSPPPRLRAPLALEAPVASTCPDWTLGGVDCTRREPSDGYDVHSVIYCRDGAIEVVVSYLDAQPWRASLARAHWPAVAEALAAGGACAATTLAQQRATPTPPTNATGEAWPWREEPR